MKARRSIAASAIAAAVLLAATLLGGGTFSDGGGTAAAATNAAPANTTRPTVSGTARVGQTLTAATGSWSGSPTGYDFQWQRCSSSGSDCADIPGATSGTYALVAADEGKTIGVGVTASNADGSSTAYSALVGPVPPQGSAPAYTTQPSISGTAKEGEKLSASRGAWSGTEPISYSYQWQRCDTAGRNCDLISGATGDTYVLAAADVGHTVLVGVIARNAYGTVTGFTQPTAVVAAGPSLLPSAAVGPVISGTAAPGQTLSVSDGTWQGAAPLTFTYQWQRCDSAGQNCASIGGATGRTYKVTSADAGHALVVSVTAKNAYGTKTAVSAFRVVGGSSSSSSSSSSRTVEASGVNLPNRLVISGVAFDPRVLTQSTDVFSARFRVTDSSGNPVSGALVYAIALPYGRVSGAPEVKTDGNGYATLRFTPRIRFSTRRGYIVFFVRARKPGDNLLAGVSTRRLVQVTTRR
jgi:hypothetical protein